MERLPELIEKLCLDKSLLPILKKVEGGERLSFEEGLRLMETDDVHAVGMMADLVKRRKSGNKAYFVVNRHINPTNICAISCKFCAFGKTKKSPDAYEMSIRQIIGMLHEDLKEVHIVGGLHPDWEFGRYLEIVRAVKDACPGCHVKAFTAVEIDWFSEISGKPFARVLEDLTDAGVDALTGGGAEVLHPEVRNRICAPKTAATRWEEIHKLAHHMNIPTNATILYGHLEKPFHVIDHFERLRNIEDEAPGFLAFIPVLFQPENTGLSHIPPFPASYDMKVHAAARLFLDNFPHIKAYWITLGERTAQVALQYGASDADGTIMREKIIHDAGAPSELGHSRDFMVHMIKGAGRVPVERDALYNEIRVYD